jgi:hypothetical protein
MFVFIVSSRYRLFLRTRVNIGLCADNPLIEKKDANIELIDLGRAALSKGQSFKESIIMSSDFRFFRSVAHKSGGPGQKPGPFDFARGMGNPPSRYALWRGNLAFAKARAREQAEVRE